MKKRSSSSLLSPLFLITLSSLLFWGPGLHAEMDKKAMEELKKSYPLKTCVVSGEKLESGPMGESIDYVYTSKDKDGKESSRLVRFCCKGCVKSFNKSPDKYLKVIDEAQEKKSSGVGASS